jgi:hypothetical protein
MRNVFFCLLLLPLISCSETSTSVSDDEEFELTPYAPERVGKSWTKKTRIT